MPKVKAIGATLGRPISIRLPPDEEAYYRKQAAAHRMPLNAYLAKTLVQGATAENMLEFEERIQSLLASIPQAASPDGGGTGPLPDALALSILTCEAILSRIAESNDQKELYAAQDAARARFKKLKGG